MLDRRNSGFSLAELIVTMGLSVAIVAACLHFFTLLSVSLSALSTQSLLQQELILISDIMGREIARAGYGHQSAPLSRLNSVSAFQQHWLISAQEGEQPGSCLLYSVDINHNGIVDHVLPAEQLGFRLHDGSIEYRMGAGSCTSNGWQDLTDSRHIEIVSLAFTQLSANLLRVHLVATSALAPDQQTDVSRTLVMHNG